MLDYASRKTSDEVARHASSRILIVEYDELFRGIVATTLKNEGYQVVESSHGTQAQDVISLGDIHAVISGKNIPGLAGHELLRFAKATKPGIAFIFVVETAEAQEAAQFGADAVLTRPIKKETLIETLEKCLRPKNVVADIDNLDLQFCKLNLDDFVSSRETKFDVYVRLTDRKYIKIAHENEELSVDRLQAYREKNVKHLYMKRDDFKKYVGFNVTLAPLVASRSSFSQEKKMAFLKHTNDVIMEHVHRTELDEESFQNAKTIVESTVCLLNEPDDLMQLLLALNSHTDHLYAHSLGVSMYSAMIAKELKWTSHANIVRVAMGGLLHDIGKKEIDPSILKKPRKNMTSEEIKLYESHPIRGLEILGSVSSIPSDVIQVAMQHHESCLGLGFPMGLSKNNIHPMARIVSVANEFCSLTLKGPNSLNLPIKETLNRMFALYSRTLDTNALSALFRIFHQNFPTPTASSQ